MTRTVRTIARKELLELVRDGRARWAAVIVLGLLLAAVIVGAQHYEEGTVQHRKAQETVRQQWVDQPEKNPHSGAHYGTYAFKPMRFLSAVDPGVNPYVGVAVWIEAHIQNEFEFKPAEDATAVQRFGELSTAVVLQVFLPLLIILFSFSVFSAEREQGTLRQVLGTGVQLGQLAAGKALGVGAGLNLLLVPAAILGSVALVLLTDTSAARQDLGRIALLSLAYLLYFAATIALSLAVSARARSSRTALLILLSFWIFNSLVAPRLTSDLARLFYPTPSSFEFDSRINQEINYGADGKTTQRVRIERLRKQALTRYGVGKVEDMPVNFYGLRLEDNERWGYQIFDKYYGELNATYRKQNRFRQVSALASPLLAVRSVSMALAGTDVDQHWDFATAAEQYRRLEIKAINDDITFNGAGIEDYRKGRDLWDKIPDFQYSGRSLWWTLKNQLLSGVILLLWLAASTLWALRASRTLKA